MSLTLKNITNKTLQCIAYGNGINVVVGNNGYIATSTDLMHWVERVNPASIDNKNLYYVIYDGNPQKFVAVGENMAILISDDGINWTKQIDYDTSYGKSVKSIIFDNVNSRFIVYWRHSTYPWERGCIYSNDNAVTWSNQINFGNVGAIGNDVIKFKNVFILVGTGEPQYNVNGGIRTSNTGINDFVNRHASVSMYGICKNKEESITVAVGSNGYIATSTDGISWIKRNSNVTYNLMSVTYFKESFYAIGENGVILKSNDGVIWEMINSEFTNNLYRIKAYNKNIYIVGENGLLIYNNISKYLINQHNNYYSTKSNFINLGQPTDNIQLENWYNKYGADDVNIITQNLNNKEFPMSKDENGIWKTDSELDINEVIDSIELVDIDENNKSIKYNCNDYRILDLCDDKFKLTMCKSK